MSFFIYKIIFRALFKDAMKRGETYFIILDMKPNIYTKLCYLKKTVKKIGNYQVLARFHGKGNISTSSFG
jgi:hypothetical protein